METYSIFKPRTLPLSLSAKFRIGLHTTLETGVIVDPIDIATQPEWTGTQLNLITRTDPFDSVGVIPLSLSWINLVLACHANHRPPAY
jgi:hypothetical protein